MLKYMTSLTRSSPPSLVRPRNGHPEKKVLLDLLAGGADGVYAVDNEQRITYWSPSAEKILGHKAADAIGKYCYEFMLGEDYDRQPFCRRDCPTMVAARRGRGVPAYDICSRTRSGREMWISISIIPAAGRSQDGPVAIHLFRDVTDRRLSEALARQTLDAVRGFMESSRLSGDSVERPAPAPAPRLSARELEVLGRLSQGDSTTELAENLSISVATARNHMDRVMRKLGVHSRLKAVVRAAKLGLI
jgi:PAS domain S-box-containing protein